MEIVFPALGSLLLASWPAYASFTIGTSVVEVLVEGVGVLAAAVAYLFVRRLPSDTLTLGWGLLTLGLFCDFLDEFGSAHAGYDVLEGFFKAGGTTLVAVGFFVSYRTLAEQLRRSREAEQAVAQTEQRFRTLFEEAPVGYHEVAPDGAVLRANRKIHQMLGYEPGTLVGRAVQELRVEPPPDPGLPPRRDDADAASRKELLYRTADGELVPLEVHENDIPGAEGLSLGVRSALLDLRDRKRAEAERRNLEVQLLQAQKLETVGTMAGGIAHDFNNLLTPILGHVDLLLADVVDPEQREALLQVRRSTDRARKLVARILTFSRRGGHEGVREPVDMGEILAEAVDFLRSSLPASVELRVEQGEPHLWVAGDATRLQQVILNLGTNGADAMDRSGVLTLSLGRSGPPEGAQGIGAGNGASWVHLSVRDDGRGIPPEVMERIFDPFFTTKPTGEGTGLGLSVAHGIAGDHGGVLTVESEPGVGSTFHVFLPAAPPAATAVGPAPPPASRGHEHVFVVDDEEPVREVLRRLLERLGYRVTTAGDPMEALERLEDPAHAPDLLITDLSMPGLSGLELGGWVAARTPELPLILLTGYAEELTRKELRAAGIQRVLRKPVDLGELSDAIRGTMDRRAVAGRPA